MEKNVWNISSNYLNKDKIADTDTIIHITCYKLVSVDEIIMVFDQFEFDIMII